MVIRDAVDMKFPIHIHRFCVDIHGYVHIYRCLPVLCGRSSIVTLLSHIFVLYFIFIPISSILFNFLLQLLFTDLETSTDIPMDIHIHGNLGDYIGSLCFWVAAMGVT